MALCYKYVSTGVAIALAWGSMQSLAAEPAPLEAFARTPRVAHISISPDRRFLAYVISTDDVRSVLVHDRFGKEESRTLWSNDGKKNKDVRWCGWANAKRLVCATVSAAGKQTSARTNVFRATRLIAFDHDGGNPMLLMHEATLRRTLNQDDLIDWSPSDPQSVLVQLRKGLDDSEAVYRLNVHTNAMEEQTRLAGIASYKSDGTGTARLAQVLNETASVSYFVRLVGESRWRRWGKLEHLEANDEIEPWAVLPGANTLIGAKLHEGRLALWEADLQRKESAKVLYASPRYDVSGIEIGPGGRLLGVRHDGERPHVEYRDSRAKSVIEGADRFLPDAFNSIADVTPDGAAYIVRSQSDVQAGTYHLLDASANAGALEQIGESYPELRGHALGRMQPVEYAARDGVKIPAYLTLPTAQSNAPRPLVVMPHDGPLDRTRWEFDYLRAFLADRGYAVLEMNYRGSSGYGWDWQQAGFREWAGRVYDDILDGARWAVESGIADRERVCIAGHGFGGYQALLGAARNADVYRCAISIGAWSNLVDARTYSDVYAGGRLKVKELGTNTQALTAQSPIKHAASVQIPVMLVHAQLDSEVPATQSQAMAVELRRQCKPHELVILPEADRDLRWQSDREELLAAVERFLANNLMGARRAGPFGCEQVSGATQP